MNRLSNVISSMNYRDLKAIEKDLYQGNIGKLVRYNIEKFESNLPSKICATCGIEHKETPRYTLMFGPDDFRKRATFCGLDCLNFFVQKLDTQQKKIVGQ